MAAPQGRSTLTMRHKKQQTQLEAKLQWHMDREDQRVKELTEGVLYDFLPAALEAMLPSCEDPLQELTADWCRAVAAAALAVSSLMNAPPGFLEFLLCIPWRQLPQLYPTAGSSPISAHSEQLLEHLAVDGQERLLLVNMPIHPALLHPVVQFMYRPEHADSVPPMLRSGSVLQQHWQEDGVPLGGGSSCPSFTAAVTESETVAALLDGATSLHCAAIRGNPASVHHLLHCGADPTLRTAAGLTPLELVPVCGGVSRKTGARGKTRGARDCKCLGPAEQEVWECRSRLACTLIAQRCLASFHIGLMRFLALLWLCLLSFLGIVGGTTSQRSTLHSHVQRRRLQQQQSAQACASGLLLRMRQECALGRRYLRTAKQRQALVHAKQPPNQSEQSSNSSLSTGHHAVAIKVQHEDDTSQEPLAPVTPLAAEAVGATTADVVHSSVLSCHCSNQQQTDQRGTTVVVDAFAPKSGLESGSQIVQHDSRLTAFKEDIQPAHAHLLCKQGQRRVDCKDHLQQQTAISFFDQAEAVESAFKCYVRAAHALQSLDLQGGILPKLLTASTCHGGECSPPDNGGTSAAMTKAQCSCQVAEAGPSPVVATPENMVYASNHANDACRVVNKISIQQQQQQPLAVLEDEQAEVYCCWAESVLLKCRACSCPGCTALAVQAIRMAHIAVARLHERMQQLQQQPVPRYQAVGHCLSRVVYVHIALLCQTEMRMSPSKASLWRAQHCLQEWDALAAAGLLEPDLSHPAASAADLSLVDALRMWSRTAESDLIIAEGLLGSSLAPHTTLNEALSAALANQNTAAATTGPEAVLGKGIGISESTNSSHGAPVLVRPITAAVLDQLQVARGLATCPSPHVKHLAAQVADAAARELSAASKLKNVLASCVAPGSVEGAAALADAIAAGAPFPSLAADVAAARVLHEQCCQRTEVANKLQDTVQQVVELTSQVTTMNSSDDMLGSTSADFQHTGCEVNGVLLPIWRFNSGSWQKYISVLEAAVLEAKGANVSVEKARRLIKELQAQLSAAEATALLQCCLSKRPCGSAALKTAISKAETAAAAVSNAFIGGSSSNNVISGPGAFSTPGSSSSSTAVFHELLVQQLQAAKKRLEIERAADALHRALVAHRSLADLTRLEAAILNARKVGAEELSPDDYKAASELRIRLATAARVKQQLDTALKCLTATGSAIKDGKQAGQLIEPVEAAIEEAKRWDDLLPGEASRAANMLEAWQTSSAYEAKLTRALQEGSSSAQLSRLITDAAAAGVKVASARKVLKLQQLLEQAIEAAADVSSSSATALDLLAGRLEAAEQAGVASVILERARGVLTKLAALEAKGALEAALKPHSDWNAEVRMAAIRAALDKAEAVLEVSVQELAEQQQQQRQQLQADSQHCSSDGSLMTDVGEAKVQRELSADVCQLALRAWELLQQDQRVLDEINRKKAEKEIARKALKEQERQERMRVEADRVKRSKAEREKQAAERKQARARAVAERGKHFAALWGGTAKAHEPQPTDRPIESIAGGHSATGSDNSRFHSPRSGSPKPATAPSCGSGVDAAVLCADAATAGRHVQEQGQVLHTVDNEPQHVRSDSYDLFQDVSSTIGHEVMALLDMHDHAAVAVPPYSPQQQQQPQQQLQSVAALTRRSSFDTTVSLQRHQYRMFSDSRGEMHQHAGSVCWQASEQPSTASSRSSSNPPAAPKFGLVDLGGASWGVDTADGPRSGLGHLSPTKSAAAGGSIDCMQPGGHGPLQASVADSSAGVWSPSASSLESGLLGASALPFQLPKQGKLLSHTGRPYNSSGSIITCPAVCSPDCSMLPYGTRTATQHLFEQQVTPSGVLCGMPGSAPEPAVRELMKPAAVPPAAGNGVQADDNPQLAAMTSVSQPIRSMSALSLQSPQLMALEPAGMPAANMPMLGSEAPANMLGSLGTCSNLAQRCEQTQLKLQQQQQQQQQMLQTQQLQGQQELIHMAQHQLQQAAPQMMSTSIPSVPASAVSISNVGRYSSSFAFGAPHLSAFSSSTIDGRAAVSRYHGTQIPAEGNSPYSATGVNAASNRLQDAATAEPNLLDKLPAELTFSPT